VRTTKQGSDFGMRLSTKCSVALHLLILLEVFKSKKLTSETLSRSVGSNPVVIRNVIGALKKAGIVDVQRGTGGASLAVAPENITIWSVYQAVETTPLSEIIGLHPHPEPKCPVGSKIGALLKKPYGSIADSVKQSMSSYTLRQLLDDYTKECSADKG
jgi:DNA-binding IscR family transcriptional regulator